MIGSNQLNVNENLMLRDSFSGDFYLRTDKDTQINISVDVQKGHDKWILRGAAELIKRSSRAGETNYRRAYSFKQVELHKNTPLGLGAWNKVSSRSQFQLNFSDGFNAQDLGAFANENLLEIHSFADAISIKSHYVAGSIVLTEGAEGNDPEENQSEENSPEGLR